MIQAIRAVMSPFRGPRQMPDPRLTPEMQRSQAEAEVRLRQRDNYRDSPGNFGGSW